MIGIGISIPMMMPFAEDATAFVRSGVLRSPFTIARAQTGGVQSSAVNGGNNGLTFYGADVPRFNGPAQRLLIEGQTTNFVQQPVAVSSPTGAWSQGGGGTATPTLTRDFSVSPGGIQDAARVRWVGPNTGNVTLRVPTSGAPVGTTCTVSFWAFTRSLGNASSAFVDLMDGAVSANILSQFVLNQWVRVVAAGVVSGSNASAQWVDLTFSGFTTGEIDFDCWGNQGEERSFATSLVFPPAGTPGASTRGHDRVSASLSSLGIAANGACTVLWSGVVPNFITGSTHTIACLDDGTGDNRFTMRVDQASGQLQAQRSLLPQGSATANAGAVTAGAAIKGGMALNGSGRAAVSLNGGAVAAVTGGPSSGLTQFRLGNLFADLASMFGETTSLRILPFVSDSDLQSLTGAMP